MKRKFNVTPSNINEFLPESARLIVRHFHPGNSRASDRKIKGGKVSPYITHALIVPKGSGRARRILAEASAICSPHDQPNRQLSFRIAAGRACRAFHGRARSPHPKDGFAGDRRK